MCKVSPKGIFVPINFEFDWITCNSTDPLLILWKLVWKKFASNFRVFREREKEKCAGWLFWEHFFDHPNKDSDCGVSLFYNKKIQIKMKRDEKITFSSNLVSWHRAALKYNCHRH